MDHLKGSGRPAKPAGEFGLALHAARVAAGLTQTEAAAVIGAHHETIGRWERGVNAPRAVTRVAILAALAAAGHADRRRGKEKSS